MMTTWIGAIAMWLAMAFQAEAAAPPGRSATSPQAFVGTWVGTESWAIDNPPPGAPREQPVTIVIDVVDGKITGSMTPFLGGEDGATFVDGHVVGDELQGAAVFGRLQPGKGATVAQAPVIQDEEEGPRVVPTGRNRGRPSWKDATAIQFVFKNDGYNNLKGSADITMNGVKWLRFSYDLSKKRSRY